MKIYKGFSVTVICFLLSGCISLDRYISIPEYQSVKDPSFTYQSLKEGQLIFAPTLVPKERSRYEYDKIDGGQISSALATYTRYARKELIIESGEDFQNYFSDSQITSLLNLYSTGEPIPLYMVARLRNRVPQRYIIFSRIHDIKADSGSFCSVSKSLADYEEGDSDGSYYDSADHYIEPPYELARWSSIYALLSFDVFDSKLNKIVWSGRDGKRNAETNTYYPPQCYSPSQKKSQYPYPSRLSLIALFPEIYSNLLPHFPHRADD